MEGTWKSLEGRRLHRGRSQHRAEHVLEDGVTCLVPICGLGCYVYGGSGDMEKKEWSLTQKALTSKRRQRDKIKCFVPYKTEVTYWLCHVCDLGEVTTSVNLFLHLKDGDSRTSIYSIGNCADEMRIENAYQRLSTLPGRSIRHIVLKGGL